MSEFTPSFRRKILTLLVKDRNFAGQFALLLPPEIFEGREESIVGKILLEYQHQYGLPAAWETFEQKLLDMANAGEYNLDDTDFGQVRKFARRIFKGDTVSLEAVQDRVGKFVRSQLIKAALLKAAEFHQEDRFEDVKRVVDEAVLSSHVGVEDVDYFEAISRRTRQRQSDQDARDPVPTGVVDLDDSLRGKGVDRGSLAVVMAPNNYGKTYWLIGVSKHAVIARRNASIVPIEDSSENMEDRLDMTFSQKSLEKLRPDASEIARIVRKVKWATGANLFIQDFKKPRITVDDIRSYLKYRTAKGTPIDLIAIDSADLMTPSRTFKDKRHEYTCIYRELLLLAKEENIVIWTSTWSNRASESAFLIQGKHASEDINKMTAATIVITINRSLKDWSTPEGFIYLAKQKNWKSRLIIPMHFDWDAQSMRSTGPAIPISEYVKDKDKGNDREED